MFLFQAIDISCMFDEHRTQSPNLNIPGVGCRKVE